jgi:hypothetical protein
MNGYIAFFNGKQIELCAQSQWAAVLLAREHFKPSKTKQHMITVCLAEVNGKQVVHHADF